MTQYIIIAISCISSFIGFLIYLLISAIKSKTIAEEESKDDEKALEVQEQYAEIASRPDVGADAMLERLREDARGDSGS